LYFIPQLRCDRKCFQVIAYYEWLKTVIFFKEEQSRKTTACYETNIFIDARFLLILAVPLKMSWRRLWKTVSTGISHKFWLCSMYQRISPAVYNCKIL